MQKNIYTGMQKNMQKNMFNSKSGFLNVFKPKPKKFDLSKEDSIIKCPRCQVDMRKITRSGITIDVCDFCHGMWLDNGELDKLKNLNELKSGPDSSDDSLADIIPVPSEGMDHISSDILAADALKMKAGKRKKPVTSKKKSSKRKK